MRQAVTAPERVFGFFCLFCFVFCFFFPDGLKKDAIREELKGDLRKYLYLRKDPGV